MVEAYENGGCVVPGGVVEGTAGAVELEDRVGGADKAAIGGVGGPVEGAIGVRGWGSVGQGESGELGEKEKGCYERMHWEAR